VSLSRCKSIFGLDGAHNQHLPRDSFLICPVTCRVMCQVHTLAASYWQCFDKSPKAPCPALLLHSPSDQLLWRYHQPFLLRAGPGALQDLMWQPSPAGRRRCRQARSAEPPRPAAAQPGSTSSHHSRPQRDTRPVAQQPSGHPQLATAGKLPMQEVMSV